MNEQDERNSLSFSCEADKFVIFQERAIQTSLKIQNLIKFANLEPFINRIVETFSARLANGPASLKTSVRPCRLTLQIYFDTELLVFILINFFSHSLYSDDEFTLENGRIN